ncbi:hypothetical protein BKA70DRAFT_345064 [Coprinopsis sp. MPI-PUGE-AT-0042]|nr:hypothetical protein BKA70DRAFT_345064 [Coprinopsis sp. MPI-PUGE-AT-0042]
MLAHGPMLVRLICPWCGHRKKPPPTRVPLPQELDAQASRRGIKRREFCSASRCMASKGVLLSSTSTPVHLMSGHSGGMDVGIAGDVYRMTFCRCTATCRIVNARQPAEGRYLIRTSDNEDEVLGHHPQRLHQAPFLTSLRNASAVVKHGS